MGMLFSVGVGGGLGALARYYIAGWIQPAGAQFNWGIFIVNITGGLLMGLIVEASALKLNLSPELLSFLTVGPFALPLVWFNPAFSPRKKIILTVIVLALTYALGMVFLRAVKTIFDYYKEVGIF